MSGWGGDETQNRIQKDKRDGGHNNEITHFLALCLEGAATAGSSVVCEDVGPGGDSFSTL